MEGDEGSGVVIGDQNSEAGLINIKKSWLKILGHLLLVPIGLNLVHLLDLVLFGRALNLVAIEPLLKLFNLLFIEFLLRLLALLVVHSLLNVLRPKARRLNPSLVHIPAHIFRVFAADRLSFFLINTLHLLVLLLVTLRQ